jgi:cell division protein FtsB
MAQRKLMQGLVSRIAIGVFGLLTVAMILLAIFDDRGALAIREKHQQLEELNRDIDDATQKNEEFRKEINALRSDHDAIEKVAREQLKLVKPGEIVIQTPEDSPSK